MDTCMHKTMASVASLEKIEIIRSQEFMLSEARLKFLKKMIILGPKTAILGPHFCRILVLGPHFWWSGAQAPGAPLDSPLAIMTFTFILLRVCGKVMFSYCLCVCLGYNFWIPWHRNFIFDMVVHLDNIYVKFEYQGHWLKARSLW